MNRSFEQHNKKDAAGVPPRPADPMRPNGRSAGGTADWNRLTKVARQHVRRHYRDADRDTLDDLTQATLLGFLGADRRETVRTPEAMIETIAQRSVAQHLRWLRRWRLLLVPFDPNAHNRPDPLDRTGEIGDPLERLRFTVLELFDMHEAPCADLARERFAEVPWTRVAERLGRSHDAVLKQWSRCMERLREIVRGDGNPLLEWPDE